MIGFLIIFFFLKLTSGVFLTLSIKLRSQHGEGLLVKGSWEMKLVF